MWTGWTAGEHLLQVLHLADDCDETHDADVSVVQPEVVECAVWGVWRLAFWRLVRGDILV